MIDDVLHAGKGGCQSYAGAPGERFSKTTRWIAGVSATLVLGVWLLGGAAVWRARSDALMDWQRSLTALSRLGTQHANQTIAAADAVLLRLVLQIQSRSPQNAADLARLVGTQEGFEQLQALRSEVPQADVVTIAAADGTLINFSRSFPPPPIKLLDRDYFAAHRQDEGLGFFLSEPVKNRGEGMWTFYIARKLTGPSGDMIGLALVGIQSDYFSAFYRSIAFDTEEPALMLMRTDGKVLARYPPNESLMGRPLHEVAERLMLAQNSPAAMLRSGPRLGAPSDTRLRIVAPTLSESYPFLVSITATETLMLAHWRKSATWILLCAIVASAALVVLAYGSQRLVARHRQILHDLVQARAEADVARKAANAANQAKSAFLARMSHEIRTPLNGVIGTTDLLLHSSLNEAQRRWAEAAASSSRSLLSLVNDVLDIAKIEAGRVDLESVEFRVPALMEEVSGMFAEQAARAGVAFQLRMSADVPDSVRGDHTRLRQVLANLVGNAVKFTHAGHVRLVVTRVEEKNEPGVHLLFAVEDTGIGIAPESIAELFQPFTQAGRATARMYGGTGLGLTITTELLQLMGGRLDVSSELGKGSRFIAVVPLEPVVVGGWQDKVPLSNAPSTDWIGRRVLLAEDDQVNALVAQTMLVGWGLEVDLAKTGLEAVEFAAARSYDLIVMDKMMPGLDGLEASRRIRRAGCVTPIIAFTASAMAADRDDCLAAGMDDYLLKPFDREGLRRMLARWLSHSA